MLESSRAGHLILLGNLEKLLSAYIPEKVTFAGFRGLTHGTVRIVCHAGSMKRYGVRRLSQQHSRYCRFAPVGRRYGSIAAAVASECGQCHIVNVCTMQVEAEHRLRLCL